MAKTDPGAAQGASNAPTEDLPFLEVVVPGKPVSWKRNRISRSGRPIRDKEGIVYRRKVAEAVRDALPASWSPDGPFAVKLLAVYARTKSVPKGVPPHLWKQGAQCLKPSRRGPDVDRIAGHVLDALTDAGVYADDGQVTDLSVAKRWAALGEDAHLLVAVTSVAQSA